ncbi:MAG: hypothetical protein K8F93_11080 [Burkholderiales bacterium]|nr:hypothetical protein [Burkholderiales bacterium]
MKIPTPLLAAIAALALALAPVEADAKRFGLDGSEGEGQRGDRGEERGRDLHGVVIREWGWRQA